MEILEENSQNIVDLIRRQYEEITSTITINVDNVPDDVIVTLKANCKGDDAEEVTNTCLNVDLGSSVNFVAEIQARRCLDQPATISISPVGLNQSLEVFVDTICDCQCEEQGNFEPNSPSCSGGRGSNQCGICVCNPGFSGQSCECDANDVPNAEDPKSQCRDPDHPNVVCNGRGSCLCGICFCDDAPDVRCVVFFICYIFPHFVYSSSCFDISEVNIANVMMKIASGILRVIFARIMASVTAENANAIPIGRTRIVVVA